MLDLLPHRLAEQAGGTQDQDQHQDAEGEDILVGTGDIAGGEGLGEAQDQAAEDRPGDVADAAEDRRGEGFDSRP